MHEYDNNLFNFIPDASVAVGCTASAAYQAGRESRNHCQPTSEEQQWADQNSSNEGREVLQTNKYQG